MKNIYKNITVVILACISIAEIQAQTTVTIPATNPAGTGSAVSSHRKPLGTNRSYERAAMKYTQAEIGILGNITSVSFYCDTTNAPGKTTAKVYIKEVPDSTFTASTVATEETGATLVFNDTLFPAAFVQNSWVTVTLSTVFPHLTTNNIEVIVETNSGGTAGTDLTTLSKGFRYFSKGLNRFQYWQSATGSGVIPAGPGTLNLNRPNIQLNIAAAAVCTSPPTPGTTNASPMMLCSGSTTNLTLTGNSSGLGQTYQWVSSPDGIVWSNIGGATSSAYTATVSAATYYACVLTCTAMSDTSTNVLVGINPFYQCYCTATLGGNCAASAIDSVSITTTTLNNGPTGCSPGFYTAYPASGSTTASLTQGQTYLLHSQFTGNVRASVWIDYNHNGIFETTEWKQICTTSVAGTDVAVSILVPMSALPGLTGMRVRSRVTAGVNDSTSACTNFGTGETEDYVITIVAAVPCTSPPTAGTTMASASAVCAPTNVNLSLSGSSSGVGMTYQWLSSPNGVAWTPIAGANTPLYSAVVNSDTLYTCVLTCSGMSDTATAAHITLNPFYQCYCTASLGGNCATTAIDSVAIATTTLNNGPTGCSPGFYTAYPPTGSTTATLMQGQTYTVNTMYTGVANASLWIDYNQNGVFDSTEWIQLSTATTAFTNVATPLSIPISALTGMTGMRIRSRSTAGLNDSTVACTTFGSGETEDYLITIVSVGTGINEQTKTSMYLFPNPVSGKLNVSLNLANNSRLNYQILNMNGEVIYTEQTGTMSGTVNKTIDVSGFAKGVYLIRVITDKEIIMKKIIVQ